MENKQPKQKSLADTLHKIYRSMALTGFSPMTAEEMKALAASLESSRLAPQASPEQALLQASVNPAPQQQQMPPQLPLQGGIQ